MSQEKNGARATEIFVITGTLLSPQEKEILLELLMAMGYPIGELAMEPKKLVLTALLVLCKEQP